MAHNGGQVSVGFNVCLWARSRGQCWLCNCSGAVVPQGNRPHPPHAAKCLYPPQIRGNVKTRIAAIAAALTMLTPATHAEAGSVFTHLAVGDARFYMRLAKCETGANYAHSTLRYTSGFGVARGVWQKYSNSSDAARYTPRQQAMVVDRIAFLGFTTDTGEYIPPVGPWGFATIRVQNCLDLQGLLCSNKKPVIAKWRRHCK